MSRWLRIDQNGRVTGVTEGDRATAELNCRPGEMVKPCEGLSVVNHTRPEDDPFFMRRTGYPDLAEQVGALMKVVPALLAGESVDVAARAELLAIVDRIATTKAMHPKLP